MATPVLPGSPEANTNGSTGVAVNHGASGHTPTPVEHQLAASINARLVTEAKCFDTADRIRRDLLLFQNTGIRKYLWEAVGKLYRTELRPYAGFLGAIAFLHVETEWSDDECNDLIAELMTLEPTRPPHNPVIVKLVHDILSDYSDDDEKKKFDDEGRNPMIGEKLGFAGLHKFLDMCQEHIKPNDHRDVTKKRVKAILEFVQISLTIDAPPEYQWGFTDAECQQIFSSELETIRTERRRLEADLKKLSKNNSKTLKFLRPDNFVREWTDPEDKAKAENALHVLEDMVQHDFDFEMSCIKELLGVQITLDESLSKLEKFPAAGEGVWDSKALESEW